MGVVAGREFPGPVDPRRRVEAPDVPESVRAVEAGVGLHLIYTCFTPDLHLIYT
jgi:hypothetical protein